MLGHICEELVGVIQLSYITPDTYKYIFMGVCYVYVGKVKVG